MSRQLLLALLVLLAGCTTMGPPSERGAGGRLSLDPPAGGR